MFQAQRQTAPKEGRRIEAKHVKRKQLGQYLPPNILQRHKRQVICIRWYRRDFQLTPGRIGLQGLSTSVSNGNLANGNSANNSPAGSFVLPRKRPSDAALDAVMMKKIRTKENADGTRNLEVRSSSPS